MKLASRFLTAAAALLLASTASADVTIYITGSTAFRAATSNALKNLMSFPAGSSYTYNDGTTTHNGLTYGYVYDGSSYSGATHQMLIGTVSGISGTVIVKSFWSGALAGVQALDQPALNSSIPNYGYFAYPWDNASVVVSSTGINNTTTGLTTDTSNSTIAMADNTQGATPFNNTTLTDTVVGIVPFVFVASNSAPSGLTNVTPQLLQVLFGNGTCSASLFTNNPADQDNLGGTRVYAAGRDPLSGTRLNTFAEMGFGIYSSCVQYMNTGTLSGTSIATLQLVPGDSTLATPVGSNPGESGFASGGTLANMMRYATTSTTYKTRTGKACFVTYLGEGDAVTAVQTGTQGNGNAKFLSYNGFSAWGGKQVTASDATWTNGGTTITSATTGAFTGCIVGQLVRCTGFGGDNIITAIDGTNTILTVSKTATTAATGNGSVTTSVVLPTPIWNGTYTFWGYEHILWPSGTTGDTLTFGNKLATQISTIDYYSSGLALDAFMKVTRASEGGHVTQNY